MNYSNPTQPQGYAQPAQPQAPAQNNVAFIADSKTIEILNVIHPELVTGLINIAIKKFAETEDFHDYFVKDEFKQVIEPPKKSVAQKEQIAQEEQNASPASPAMDFTSW